MKLFPRILPVLAIFVFLSCKEQPTSPGTATIKGQVKLLDVGLGYTPPYSGIQVSLEGTSYSVLTDDSGLFELDDVPQGTYNIRFSKDGYGEERWIGTAIQGGGNSPIYLNEQASKPSHRLLILYKQPDLITRLTSASFKDTVIAGYPTPTNYLWISGNYTGSRPVSDYNIAVYFSHHSDVSSDSGHYTSFLCLGDTWWPWDTIAHDFQLPPKLEDIQPIGFTSGDSYPFNSGDSVYVACYGAPNYGFWPPFDYVDPNTDNYVLTSLNQTPSPIIGLKIP